MTPLATPEPASGADRLVSVSEIRTFKRCRRKWWLGQLLNLRPVRERGVGVASVGDRVHASHADYYEHVRTGTPDPEAATLEAFDVRAAADIEAMTADEFRAADVPDLQADILLARAMLEGYFEWIAETGADVDWEVLEVERPLRAPLAHETLPRAVTLVGKPDLRVRLRSTGATSFVDAKTVGSLEELEEGADLNEQFLHYSMLEVLRYLEEGRDGESAFQDGGILNLMKRSKRTARAKPPFYRRVEVRHTIERLRSYWQRLIGEVTVMQQVEDALVAGADHRAVAYPTPTRDCAWDCEFRRVCPMLDDPASRVEDFVAVEFTTGDAYARYRDGGDADTPSAP